MLMYGWMKFVELAPERYDWAVELMTAGRLTHIKERIAAAIEPDQRVLDIGCGTGSLAVRCMQRGAHVTGLDSSAFMLAEAQRNAEAEELAHSLVLVKDSVTQLEKHFDSGSFDVIVSTMALGEFPREYLQYILAACRRLLRPGGRLIIADEVLPERLWSRLLYRMAMVVMWVPQFLLLRRVFFPIRDFSRILGDGGFRVCRLDRFSFSSFQLVFCEAAGEAPGSVERGRFAGVEPGEAVRS